MKLLLTSGGISNASIHTALTDLLGKPTTEANALCIPTASYALRGGPKLAWNFFADDDDGPLVGVGWKSMGVLELAALSHVDRDRWLPLVAEADVLLVNGGDPLFLHHWMRESGLAGFLPSFGGVYVGMSAGSMVMTPRIGKEFVGWTPPSGDDDTTLGLVDFSIYPHLDCPVLPGNTMASAEKWSENVPAGSYVIDDATAIRVVDGNVEIISEGTWRQFS